MRYPKPIRSVLTVLAALSAAACSGEDDGTTPPDQFAVGPWRGTVGPAQSGGVIYTFDLTFDQDGRNLSGEGTIRGAAGSTVQSADVAVDGRFENPEFDFSLESEGFAPLVFDGRVFRAATSSLDSIAGNLTGSGLTGSRLVLRRVAQP